MPSWLPFWKLKGLLGPKISKFTKIREFQKNLFANLRLLLNDYGLIISIKTNRKAYLCVCFIFKIGDATSTLIYSPISVHALKWENIIHNASFIFHYSSFVIDPSLFIICYSCFIICHSSFIMSFILLHSSFVIHHSSFIIRKCLPVFFFFSSFHCQSDSFVLSFT